MATAVAQAYNGGLGAVPQWGPGAESLVRGLSPLKLKALYQSQTQKRGHIFTLFVCILLSESMLKIERACSNYLVLLTAILGK